MDSGLRRTARNSVGNRSRWTPPRNVIRRGKGLLPYLESLVREVPKRWDNKLKRYVTNDDWLLWDLDKETAKLGTRADNTESSITGTKHIPPVLE